MRFPATVIAGSVCRYRHPLLPTPDNASALLARVDHETGCKFNNASQLMNLNELYRLICNLVRIGTVTDVDLAAEPPVARVSTERIQRTGFAGRLCAPERLLHGGHLHQANRCYFLPHAAIWKMPSSWAACTAIAWKPPDNGETSNVTLHPDGAKVLYDPATGALAATGIKSATVEASDSIAATAPK
jgi:hypothetical protein